MQQEQLKGLRTATQRTVKPAAISGEPAPTYWGEEPGIENGLFQFHVSIITYICTDVWLKALLNGNILNQTLHTIHSATLCLQMTKPVRDWWLHTW